MKMLLAALITGALASVSTGAFAQATPGPATNEQKGKAAAYANPAAQKTAEEKAKEGMAAVEKSKNDPKARPNMSQPGTMKAQQELTKSGTNPDQAKANVEASKKVARQKPKNIKDMTPEERAALRKHVQEQSKP